MELGPSFKILLDTKTIAAAVEARNPLLAQKAGSHVLPPLPRHAWRCGCPLEGELLRISYASMSPCAGAVSPSLGRQATQGTLGDRTSVPGLPPRSPPLSSTGRSRPHLVVAAAAKRGRASGTLSVATYVDNKVKELRDENSANQGAATAAIRKDILQVSAQLSQQIAQLAQQNAQQIAQLTDKLSQLDSKLGDKISQLNERQGALESRVKTTGETIVAIISGLGVVLGLLMYFRAL